MNTAAPFAHRHTRSSGLVRSIVAVGVLIGGLFAVELIAGFTIGSDALVGDAAHMATDLISVGVVTAAVLFASRPHSLDRTFGFHRLEVFATYVNALLLWTTGITLLVLFVREITGHHVDAEGTELLAVFGVRLAINILSLVLVRAHRRHVSVRGLAYHITGDLIASVAFVVAAGIANVTGFEHVEEIVHAMVALSLLWMGWRLFNMTSGILMEATPKEVDLHRIQQDLLSIEGVSDVHDLHVWVVTSGFLALTCHMGVKAGSDSHAILSEAENLLRGAHGIEHITVQPEEFLPHDPERAWCCIEEHRPSFSV